ncbi:MAG: CPBP family intramembrane metalloprotease [Candidatus Melainabacteria bacterium]|nr:CPBP family intramembrane metalloprotease [Candidatus Melainabacteria bacterium]
MLKRPERFQTSEKTEEPFDRQTIVTISIAIEALLLLVTTAWCYFGEIDLRALFKFNLGTLLWGISAGLAISTINMAILYLSQKLAHRFFIFQSMHDLLKHEMIPIFGQLTFADSVLLSLASGFCEEVFFRGVVEASGGIATSSICFGLAHLPSFYYYPYAIWAFGVGLVMSFLMASTGSIFAPVAAHALVNLVSINVLRYIKT